MTLAVTIKPVSEPEEIIAIANLASEIWNDHFLDIIGQAQVDYMLEIFQSPHAIASQINSGYEYFLVLIDENQAGYLALVPDNDKGRVMLSKIYIRRDFRRKGLGGYLLDFVKNESRSRELGLIWLTVNRHNHETIKWYKRNDFVVVDEVKKDIGGGFFMDDYIMELKTG